MSYYQLLHKNYFCSYIFRLYILANTMEPLFTNVCGALLWKVALWYWLLYVVETCTSENNCCAMVGNKNSYVKRLHSMCLTSIRK
jgi:hypothetical protein